MNRGSPASHAARGAGPALILSLTALLALPAAIPASAGEVRLPVTIEGLHSEKGKVLLSACREPATDYPGACADSRAEARPSGGRAHLTLSLPAPGRYALQAFHDENGNSLPDFPQEGAALSNDARWPVTFSDAAIDTSQVNAATMRITYKTGPLGALDERAFGADAPEGGRRVLVRDGGLHGTYYPAVGRSAAPPVLVISGSDGGVEVSSQIAAALAESGFSSLGLAYWADGKLPTTLENIPLEYFDRAIHWLLKRPETTGQAVGIIGWSRGAEAALLIGLRNSRVKAIIAAAPTSCVWAGWNPYKPHNTEPAWTRNGEPVSFVSWKDFVESRRVESHPLPPVEDASLLPHYCKLNNAQIPIEGTSASILLLSGGDDRLWPAARFAEDLANRMENAGAASRLRHLSFPEAGHAILVGPADGPLANALASFTRIFGGSSEANRKAWKVAWRESISFLADALQDSSEEPGP